MKIVDTFLFHNEYDLLELRLRAHYDHVDRFVIAECDHTFTRKFKGFNLEKHKERFAPWWDKITLLQLSDIPVVGNAWTMEHWQRGCFKKGWTDLTPEDVVLIADVDELLRPEAFDLIRNTNYDFYGFAMPTFYFRFNYMNYNDHYPWRLKAYRGYFGDGQSMRQMDAKPGSDSKIELHHGGWHFSWLGDDAQSLDKLQSFAHTELNIPQIANNINIEQSIAMGRDHHRPELIWGPVKMDEYFPAEIRNNLSKYQHLILPDGDKTVQEYWPGGILEQRK